MKIQIKDEKIMSDNEDRYRMLIVDYEGLYRAVTISKSYMINALKKYIINKINEISYIKNTQTDENTKTIHFLKDIMRQIDGRFEDEQTIYLLKDLMQKIDEEFEDEK